MNQSLKQLQSWNEKDNEAFNFIFLINNILENRWLILNFALITSLLGGIYALSVKPVYESNILIQIKGNIHPVSDFPGNLPAALDVQTQAATEVEVLRSRSVISRAVDASQFDIIVEPKFFPIFGSLMNRRNKQISNPGLFGYGGYVWGTEQLNVSILRLPDPLLGLPFVLTVKGKEEYLFTQENLEIKFKGKVGEIAKARTEHGDIEILVAKIEAKPGAQFSVSRIPKFQAVELLQKSLDISEKGKQSNIIGVSLKGSKPELISRILNEIGSEYIRQNIAQKFEEAEKSLLFFNQQLKDSKQKLDRFDSKFTQLRGKHGIFDVNEEAKILSQQSVAVQAKLADAKQKKEELLSRFLEQHPAVEVVKKNIQELNHDLANIKAKSKELAATEYEILDVTRDKQLNIDINSGLLSTRRQLDILVPDRIANARLLDRAETPRQSVTLNPSTMIAVAGLAGVLLGVIAAFLKNAFLGRIHGPREIEQSLGLMVSVTIPHSEIQKKMHRKMRKNKKEVSVLPQVTPSEGAIESLRILRSTMQFLMRDSDRNIIMIAGPTQAVGKSFVSANFAAVLAAAGKSVLLIDGDMRTGYLHRYFGSERTNGLSDVLAMNAIAESVIHKAVVKNVDFISTGSFSNQPAELLAHANFGKLLRILSAQYDYVLIDTAPVLDFSDALIVGVYAGAIFNVVRDGVSSMNDAEEAVKRLNRAGLKVTGIILNDLKPNISRYGYGPRYHAAALSHGYQDSDAERVRIIAS